MRARVDDLYGVDRDMKKIDKMLLQNQLVILQSLKKTKAVKEQIQKTSKLLEWGDSYEPDTDWWPNKYPDM